MHFFNHKVAFSAYLTCGFLKFYICSGPIGLIFCPFLFNVIEKKVFLLENVKLATCLLYFMNKCISLWTVMFIVAEDY